MKKVFTILTTILLIVLSAVALTGCGSKYCTISGCPKERAYGAKYCHEHKCQNPSCKNMAISSYSYCRECIERAQ